MSLRQQGKIAFFQVCASPFLHRAVRINKQQRSVLNGDFCPLTGELVAGANGKAVGHGVIVQRVFQPGFRYPMAFIGERKNRNFWVFRERTVKQQLAVYAHMYWKKRDYSLHTV